jgi:hypothetical protein
MESPEGTEHALEFVDDAEVDVILKTMKDFCFSREETSKFMEERFFMSPGRNCGQCL